MPVMVRNLKPGPTVFSIPENHVEIEWQGSGDPNGNDIQEVSDEIFKESRFRRAMTRGLFQEVTVKEGEEAQRQQVAARIAREAAAISQTQASIDVTPNNDMISMPCQGPDARGTGQCMTPVPVRAAKANEAPVLCARHEGLASEFIQIETGVMIEKGTSLVPEVKFVRPVMGARESL